MSKNLFMNAVQRPNVGRNIFDLSHDVKQSMKFGLLTPTLCMQVMPGDKVNLKCESLVRLAPMVAPVMHEINVTSHYWYVPNRLTWENWEEFITHKEAGTQPSHPYVEFNGNLIGGEWTGGPLADYMGVPVPQTAQPSETIQVDAIPFQAYHLIWREFYRDQNMIPQSEVDLTMEEFLVDGDNTGTAMSFQLYRRAWEHDYFTSCLPTPQQGAALEIPLALSDMEVRIDKAGGGYSEWPNATGVPGGGNIFASNVVATGGDIDANELYVPGSEADSTSTIEDFRRASAIQRFFEKIMRTGRRYSEILEGIFGVHAQDMRLSRPEYITGVKSTVVISEVLNTTGTEQLPQGNMSGHGISVTRGSEDNWFEIKEHGWILCIMSVLPRTAYQNGLDRKFFRKTYFSYPWPDFANLGEMAVQNREVEAWAPNGTGTFGYLPQYADWKTMYNRVAGDFRGTLDYWHFGRIFDETDTPLLNREFIECSPGKRIFAVTDEAEDEIYAHIKHNILVSRMLPKFATPTLY